MSPAAEAYAQGFDSTSTGADGALTFPAGAGVVIWDPATAGPGGTPLDPEGDNIFHFTTITIPSGTTVKLVASRFGGEGRPVTWLASGDVTIEGVIDLDGAPGHPDTGPTLRSEPGAGGWSGGAVVSGVRQPGNGPGGGLFRPQDAGGGGTYRTQGYKDSGSFVPARQPYGNRYLLPLLGGSGGGSGTLVGGGAGGGAILIASSTQVTLDGEIRAVGGAAATYPGSGEATSGGSGGAIRLVAPTVSGSGVCRVDGGVGGYAPFPTAYFGGSGWIRVQAFNNALLSTGTFEPAAAASFATPGLLFPPPNAATLRVTAIDGVAAPTMPTGSFNPVDVIIDNPGPVTIEIEASNVPVGTVVTLVIASEDGVLQYGSSTPLSGSRAQSTATYSTTLPAGFTRVSLSASWTP